MKHRPAVAVLALLLLAGTLSAVGRPPQSRVEARGMVSVGGRLRTAAEALRPDLSPQDLYTLLLNTPFTDAELPAGFGSATIQPVALSATDLARNGVGTVTITLATGPDDLDLIGYTVYQTPEDAVNAYRLGPQLPPDIRITGFAPGAGPAELSEVVNASLGITPDQRIGASYCTAVDGNVIVVGNSSLLGNGAGGNADNACALTRAGLAHLHTLQPPTGR